MVQVAPIRNIVPDELHHSIPARADEHSDDPQGIPWRLLPMTREQYRSQRLQGYQNYANASKALRERYASLADFQRNEIPACAHVEHKAPIYPFHRNHKCLHTAIAHFQLRNLLWATSCHDVYAVHDNCVKHTNVLREHTRTVIDMSGATPASVRSVHVATMCVGHGFVVAGGFLGEIIVATEAGEVKRNTRVSDCNNCITNGLELAEGYSGALLLTSANNDDRVRIIDIERPHPVHEYALEWAANAATVNPHNRKVMAVAGDSPEVLLMDVQSGRVATELAGHLDFTFALAWHPGGHLLASGNQDCTTRLWDVRRPDACLAVLPASMGSVRSCRFSPDGACLAFSEPADFVHVYDVAGGLCTHQEIDFFGEIAGIAFTPGAEALFVAIPDREYMSALCYKRGPAGEHGAGGVQSSEQV